MADVTGIPSVGGQTMERAPLDTQIGAMLEERAKEAEAACHLHAAELARAQAALRACHAGLKELKVAGDQPTQDPTAPAPESVPKIYQ